MLRSVHMNFKIFCPTPDFSTKTINHKVKVLYPFHYYFVHLSQPSFLWVLFTLWKSDQTTRLQRASMMSYVVSDSYRYLLRNLEISQIWKFSWVTIIRTQTCSAIMFWFMFNIQTYITRTFFKFVAWHHKLWYEFLGKFKHVGTLIAKKQVKT